MGVRDYNERKRPVLVEKYSDLVLLIGINAIIFIILNFLYIVFVVSAGTNAQGVTEFQNGILKWFLLPPSFQSLANKPWTIFVYMITHFSIWSLISTVLWLWAFGFILQDLAGNKKLIPLYLYGGLAGAFVFLLSMNFIPFLHQNINAVSPMAGGGAAIMAIVVGTTTIAPNYRMFPFIHGGIPLWILTVVFVLIDYAGIASEGGGYALAHLAGAAIGFLYVVQLKKGKDWGAWMYDLINWFDDLFNPERKQKKQNQKEALFYKASTQPYKKTPNLTQQRLDEILDKINKNGYELLSDDEKAFLKRASKEEL